MTEFKDLSESSENLSSKKFSPETKEALEKEGYLIYSLTGKSIKDLREEGMKFSSTWRENYPDFEILPSRQSEIAINLKQLFLPNSNNKTLVQQEQLVKRFSQKLSQRLKGVRAIIGEAPDYVELAFNHLKQTGERLFGEKYNYNYTRTETLIVGPHVVHVGYFGTDTGLGVRNLDRGLGQINVWVAPLVVPA